MERGQNSEFGVMPFTIGGDWVSKPSVAMIARIRLEKRKGKEITIIEQIEPSLQIILLSDLKKICHCGGALKENKIELQGDHRKIIALELSKRGIKHS